MDPYSRSCMDNKFCLLSHQFNCCSTNPDPLYFIYSLRVIQVKGLQKGGTFSVSSLITISYGGYLRTVL